MFRPCRQLVERWWGRRVHKTGDELHDLKSFKSLPVSAVVNLHHAGIACKILANTTALWIPWQRRILSACND